MKKLISLALTLSLLLSLLPAAYAAETGPGEEAPYQEEIVEVHSDEEPDEAPVEDSDEDPDEDLDEDLDEALDEDPDEDLDEDPDADLDEDPDEDSVEDPDAVPEEIQEVPSVQPTATAAAFSTRSTSAVGSASRGAGLAAIAQTNYVLADGVSYDKLVMRNKDNEQVIGYLTNVDLSANVKLKATYSGYYTKNSTAESRAEAADSLNWNMSMTTKLANEYASIADPEGTVVMATNGDYFNMGTGEPLGYLIMEGNAVRTGDEPYFAILEDGSAVIRDAGADHSDVVEAVSGPLYLIKDGQIQVGAGDVLMPRNSVGIREDGSVVFFEADGRQAPTSIGMDLYETACILKDAGCVTALYLDGGGSATVAARHEGSDKLEVVNSPSDGAERTVSSAILCISTADATGVFDHVSITPKDELYTPGSKVQFTASGVDTGSAPTEIPDDVVWALSEDSAEMGDISEDGLFNSNGVVGTVTVEMQQDGECVGFTTIEIVEPDEITFNSDEVSLGFEESTDLGLVVRKDGRDVHYKDDDIAWEVDNDAMGTFSGNIFTASDGESLNGYITATSVYNESVSGRIHVIVGMLPTIVWDFEDQVDEDGNVISAEDYYGSILTHSNYNRGGQESFEIVSIDDDEPVRFGEKSLKLNYDFTQCGAVTEGACVGTTVGMAIPGSPTGIGVWVYAPEGVGITWGGDGTQAGFWLRGYVRDANGTNQAYDFTLEPKAVSEKDFANGVQPGIYWEGWKYLEADLTKLVGPFSIQPGMTFRLMYVAGTKMGTKTANSIYFDNLQFVYGTNVDDVDSPLVDSITVNGMELEDGDVLNAETLTIRAEFSDVQNKYTSGVDASTVRMYIDGVNVADNDRYEYALVANDGYAALYNMSLTEGLHSVTVSLRDGFGNDVSETRYFTVNTGAAEEHTTVTVAPVEKSAPLGGQVTLEIRASDDTVMSSTTQLRLGNMFPNYQVEFSDNYVGEVRYSKSSSTITITAQRNSSSPVEGGNLIARVLVDIPSTLTSNESFVYEVKGGSYLTSSDFYGTYSAPETRLPLGTGLLISCDPILVGVSGVIRVTDADGNAVADVGIYLSEGDTLLGTTDENGQLVTDAFSSTAGKTAIYAKSSSGMVSFLYNVYSYAPQCNEDGTPEQIMFNVPADSTTEKNISWFTSPLCSDAQQIRYRVSGSENWTALTARTELHTFVKGGDNKAANISRITLSGLTPGTDYEYQVGAGEAWSAVGNFSTDSASDQSRKFFVLGDIQADDQTNITNIIDQLKAGGYDFGIQTGDAIDDVTGYGEVSSITNLLGTQTFGDTDVLHVLGNHEYYGDANGELAAAIYNLPEARVGSYYSVTCGEVYIAVINYTSTNAELIEALEWLVEDAQASDATWKVLTMHQPPYYTNATGGNAPVYQYVPDAAEAAGINVVFSGHDHSLARTNRLKGDEIDEENGIYYYICGSSGEKSYSITSQSVFDYDKIFALATIDFNATYLSVTADEEAMVINVYDMMADGTPALRDSVTLESLYGECSASGHQLDNPVCSDGKLLCGKCGKALDPKAIEYTGWAVDQETGLSMYFLRGQYQTGWFLIDTDEYCFDENGVAYDGEQTVDEVPFVFDNGLVVSGYTGFITKSNGKTYYYDNGVMAVGVTRIGEDDYYFYPVEDSEDYGAMRTGSQVINGVRYQFYPDGRMYHPTVITFSDDYGIMTVKLQPYDENQRWSAIRMAVWSQTDGQDDLRWFHAQEQDDGSWIVQIPMCLYTLIDRYIIHIYDGTSLVRGEKVDCPVSVTHKFTNYVSGSGNNCIGAVSKTAYCDYGCGTTDTIGGVVSYHDVTAELSSGNRYLTIQMADVASHKHTKVKFAVWSEVDGQDDLAWYPAEKTEDGNWTAVADLKDHNSTGVYQIHAYAYTGEYRFAGHTAINAEPITIQTGITAAVSDDCTKMDITMVWNENVDDLRLAVWSRENGQDDLHWYPAQSVGENTYTCQVDLTKHNSAGIYDIHAYSYDETPRMLAHATAEVAEATGTTNLEAVVSEDCSVMNITLTTKEQYNDLKFAVWSRENGQDDLVWYPAEKTAEDTYVCDVNVADHNSTGIYDIHAYSYDGTPEMVAHTTAEVTELPTVPSLRAEVSEDCAEMAVTFAGGESVNDLRFAVWSEENGQDDIRWYKAEKNADGEWTYVVDLSAHHSAGTYNIHVYSFDGTPSMLDHTTVQVHTAVGSRLLKAEITSDGTAMQIFYRGEALDNLQFAVWSEENGQDDLHWYDAEFTGDGWTYTVDLSQHGISTLYNIHLYTERDGTMEFVDHCEVRVAVL